MKLCNILLAGLITLPFTLRAALPTGVQAKPFYDTTAIRFNFPVWFGEYPGRAGSFMVGELGGGLYLLERNGETYRKTSFAAIPAAVFPGNDGLLGIAFHPGFLQNRKYYVYSITQAGQSLLEERQANQTFSADAGTSRALLRIDFKPLVHNGGDMHFGRDGYLYIGLGDQGNPNVFNSRAQKLDSLAGKMLRIDVDRKDPGLEYAIPADNPFAQRTDATRKEIYAYGLRQPWRWSFDALDGRMLVADVGDWIQEEIDVVRRGGDYGWSRMEGNSCFNPMTETQPLDQCDTAGLIAPIAVLPHIPVSTTPTSCIIGGYVFRGYPGSPFYGAYIFADYETDKIYGLAPGGAPETIGVAFRPVSFGSDAGGNLYVVQWDGKILRLEHPDLMGTGSATRPKEAPSGPPGLRRSGGKLWLAAGASPGLESVSLFTTTGKRVAIFTRHQLSQGASCDLPPGLYLAQATSRTRTSVFALPPP